MYNSEQQKFLSIVTAFVLIFLLFMCFIMFSCTYNISMVHTEGAASDVIETTQTPTSDVKAEIPLI